MQELYRFNPRDYNRDGYHIRTNTILHTWVQECEKEFYEQHKPIYANHFRCNGATMILLQNSYGIDEEENYSFGMDIYDGEADVDKNLVVDEHSERPLVYAIASAIKEKEDEPMFIAIDNSMPDGQILLKWKPENDEDNIEEPVPEGEPKKKSSLNSEERMIAIALKRKRELTPVSGYNVVGIDDFEMPEDALYLIGHFESREDAEMEKKKYEKRGIKCYVYDKDTK